MSAAPRRRGFRELLVLIALQSFGNQMAGSFWLVYLVEPPQSLPFVEAIALDLVMYVVAVASVLAYSRGRGRRATRSMSIGLAFLAAGHFAFALLPPVSVVVIAAVAFGIYFAAFWLPINVLLLRETSASNRAGRLAAVTSTFSTVAILAPAVGGALAQLVGFRVLFLVGGILAVSDIALVRYLRQRDESIAFAPDFRRAGRRTTLAFSGQGAVEGLTGAATPLAAFLFTSVALDLGLLFSFFSLLAALAVWLLGRTSDRVRRRRPFLLLGPLLSVPACLVAATAHDLGTFAIAVGMLSMTASVAPSFIYTILVDREGAALAGVTAAREVALNAGRAIATVAGMILLLLVGSGASIYLLYFLVGGAVLLETVAS